MFKIKYVLVYNMVKYNKKTFVINPSKEREGGGI